MKGLRLCVTKGGVKTWWVNKWGSETQKTRAVKFGQWANQGTHCAWAKKQVGKALLEIQEGNVLTKGERELERAKPGIPTFSDALEQYITHRTTARAAGNRPDCPPGWLRLGKGEVGPLKKARNNAVVQSLKKVFSGFTL